MSEWAAQQVPSPSAPGTVTLVEGTAFCVSTPSGDILPGGTEGMFFRNTRLASRWELLIDSEPVEPMAVIPGKPYCATFVGAEASPGRTGAKVPCWSAARDTSAPGCVRTSRCTTSAWNPSACTSA